MAQALIRNIDEELLADYKAAAEANKRSLEAELREALRRARPLSPERRDEVLARFAAIRAMTPDVPQTPAEQLVREDRDHGH
ncbi:MAG: FitA-like ribbon-helix-helix domain-containing protein [Allosphingosinicella sp.]|uniref:FitA-like ribbon-helix-helix domain-containing protein n=1 Tax=Allosphingosinicella sp. TaxID=2823234 RepID=UPI003949531A